MERAELLCDVDGENGDKRRSSVMLGMLVGVIAPMMAVIPYLFALESDGQNPLKDGLMVSSVWLGCVQGYVRRFYFFCVLAICTLIHKHFSYSSITALLLHALNLAFEKIPIGVHTLFECVLGSSVCMLLSFLFRAGVLTIVPFELLFVAIVGFILLDILYGMIKFIPVKDKRTGQTKRYAIGT